MSSLSSEISSQLATFDNCNQYFAGNDEFRFCSQFTSIDVDASALLGTVGGLGSQGSAALDFGLRDTRVSPLHYANPSRLVNPDQLYVVCPYDYFAAGTGKSALFAKLENARTDQPVCGTVEHDIDNSLQGRWYLHGSNDFSENNHIALVPSNQEPDRVGVLSIGNAAVGTDAYFFDYQNTGLINRKFSDISQFGQVYCWDRLRNRADAADSGSSQPLAGLFFIKLVDEINLIIKKSTQSTTCPVNVGTFVFSSDAVSFER